ncbi:MAG: oligopeptide:H+ symporter, partial [Gammaproteobacteria bacterium]
FGCLLLVAAHLLMAIEGAPAKQVLDVEGTRFEVAASRDGAVRKLAVVYRGDTYPMSQSEEGALHIKGLPASAGLPVTLAPGHYTLSAEGRDPFFVGLLFAALSFIALGVGFLKGNVSCLVGLLYPRGDVRQDAGFTLYYFGINIGSFWAALLCGYLGFTYGWAWGFGLAAAGMIAGLLVFVLGKRLLQGQGEPPDTALLKQRRLSVLNTEHMVYLVSLLSLVVIWFLMQRNELVGAALALGSVAILYYVGRYVHRSQSKVERQRIYLSLLLTGAAVLFWMLFLQAATSLNLFADRNTNLTLVNRPWTFDLFGREFLLGTRAMLEAALPSARRVWLDAGVTAAQVQAFNVGFVMIFAPAFAWLWTFLARRGRDPSPMTKVALGLIQVGAGFLVIVWSRDLADATYRLPLIVLGFTYLLHTTGELFVSPIGLSELTRLSPPLLVSTMMAIWLLASSAAQYIGALIAAVGSSDTSGAQGLNAAGSLASSLHVFQSVGWFGVAAGLFFLALSPFVRHWAHRGA